MRLIRQVRIAVLLVCSVPCVCSAAQFECPSSIELEETVHSSISPWQSVVQPQGYQLDGAAILYRNPSEGGSQVPDKTLKQKNILHNIWYFPGKESEEFWIGCRYLHSNTLLVQQVGPGLSQCQVSYDTLPSGKVLKLKSIQCQ